MSEPIIKDGVTIGQERLVPKLKDGEGNIELLTSFLEESNALEMEAFTVNTAFDKDTAIGVQLDVIAKLVGEERKGRSDEGFREALNSRISANTAEGTVDDLISVIKNALKDSTGYPNITNNIINPNNPEEWSNLDTRTSITSVEVSNPTGYRDVGLVEQILDGGAADSVCDSELVQVYAGQKVYLGMIVKHIEGDIGLRLRHQDSGGFLGSININIETGVQYSGGGGGLNQTATVTDLGNGWKLILSESTIYRNDSDFLSQIIFEDGSSSTTAPQIGNKFYAQSPFSGTTSEVLPYKTTLAEDKSIDIVEYFPAGVHVQLQNNENQGITELIGNSVPAGVTRTVAYSPDDSEGFSFSEIGVLRRFLITNNGDRIVTNDGTGTLSNLVMQNFEESLNGDGSFFAEFDDEEFDPFLEIY